MKIAVIGFGAAAVGFLKEVDPSNDVVVFEMNKDIFSSSISGIRADGKLFVSSEMGGDLEEILYDKKLQKDIVDYYSKLSETEPEIGSRENIEELEKQFFINGFKLVESEFFHIGTDKLKIFLKNAHSEFSQKGIKFKFNSFVKDIEVSNNIKIIYLDRENREEHEEYFDKVYIAVGRSGFKLIDTLSKKYPDIILSNTKVDLGVRFELPDIVVKELNDALYEFKVKFKSSNGQLVRTFCNNPSGYVVTEKYSDFITVNGHAIHDQKSTNTNFAILVTHSFTKPFNDPNGYGSYIAKLSNILAGGDKVILQTYGDFKKGKRTKKLWKVFPTLNQNEYVLGDLNLVFPSKTSQSLVEFIDNLNKIIPGIADEENLLYGVEVKFYGKKLDNNLFENLKFIGDCSGHTRSIVHATAHGILEARKLKN
ncbi:NAD(P)/FAD-dependent oxidoreductase [Marinitoga litoralis]|uniref:NAD(P)/FAD-dependent oxidoreductase n=1 Tax=Marinitoga litoralis TaxID=570855 RepID=UPI00196130AB|nr:NAD(P)/FAD-dependent oxidoreductase [Marinitoga litoralis]MBM7559146.1 putative FAD-dependent dehydrogenase [Marinitoga litoralis]